MNAMPATPKTPPLIETRDVSKAFAQQSGITRHRSRRFVHAVDRVSIAIDPGEILGLVGESGSGKSTLGRLMIRLDRPTDGQIFYSGNDITTLKGRRLRQQRRHMQIVFQDPSASLNPRFTVRDTLEEAIRAHRWGMTKRELNIRLAALITMVGLTGNALDKFPKAFSGGQRQSIAIARALAVEPKFIVADEPVSALDFTSRSQIVDLIDNLKKELMVSFLIISHDLDVIARLSNRVAVMYLGRVVEYANTTDLFENAKHPYTRALVAASLSPDPARKTALVILPGESPSPLNPPKGCHFHPRCPHADVRCELIEPKSREIGPRHIIKCHKDL